VNVRIYRSDSRFDPYAKGRVGIDAPTGPPNMRIPLRIPARRSTGAHSLLLPAGVAALLLGLVGGLARVGVAAQFAPESTVAWHGPLILFGFLGVLVAVERAVALRRPWAFSAPLLGCSGTLLLVTGSPVEVVAIIWTCAALVAATAVFALDRREPSLANRCMLASCLAWTIGVALWGTGASLATLLPWWASFLVLMIVGERIQFGKLYYLRHAALTVTVLATLLLTGAMLAVADARPGTAVAGAAMLALGAWLVVVDVTRRVRRPGLLWYVSVGLAAAYAWLIVTGTIWLVLAPTTGGPGLDAAIHALFQGFVMGMVLAHAPMIFPAVTGRRMPFHRIFHAPLGLLQVGMVARVGGDLLVRPDLARTGSTMTAAALTLFLVVAAGSIVVGCVNPALDRDWTGSVR